MANSHDRGGNHQRVGSCTSGLRRRHLRCFLHWWFAHGINSSGEIVGFGVVTTGASAGDLHAFLATPCNDAAAERDETTERPRAVLSENAREILRQGLRLADSELGSLGRNDCRESTNREWVYGSLKVEE